MLDLQRLRALHLFAMLGTIAAAADSLGYSPAAVSQQLSTLERETGTVLPGPHLRTRRISCSRSPDKNCRWRRLESNT